MNRRGFIAGLLASTAAVPLAKAAAVYGPIYEAERMIIDFADVTWTSEAFTPRFAIMAGQVMSYSISSGWGLAEVGEGHITGPIGIADGEGGVILHGSGVVEGGALIIDQPNAVLRIS